MLGLPIAPIDEATPTCPRCGYCLIGSTSRCPECWREFSLANPSTFVLRAQYLRARRIRLIRSSSIGCFAFATLLVLAWMMFVSFRRNNSIECCRACGKMTASVTYGVMGVLLWRTADYTPGGHLGTFLSRERTDCTHKWVPVLTTSHDFWGSPCVNASRPQHRALDGLLSRSFREQELQSLEGHVPDIRRRILDDIVRSRFSEGACICASLVPLLVDENRSSDREPLLQIWDVAARGGFDGEPQDESD